MIGSIIMDISEDQMYAAVQYWLNNEVFKVYDTLEPRKVKVKRVRQRESGRFVIEFEGGQKAERPKPKDPDLSRPTTEANGGSERLPTESSIAHCS